MTLLLFLQPEGYFRKNGGAVNHRCAANNPRAELVLALQSARTRLAVAAAAGRRSTPPAVMRRYLDTDERLGRVLKKMRASREDRAINSFTGSGALESLRGIADSDDPAHLSRILGDIVAELERCIAFPEGLPL